MIENPELWTNLISNIGFPIVITLFLLVKFEKTIKENTEAMNNLKTYLKQERKFYNKKNQN